MGNEEDKRNISQGIRWRLLECNKKPVQLARQTGKPPEYIKKVIAGELVLIDIDFLRDCVWAFGLVSARARGFEDTADSYSWEECVELLKPPTLPPHHQSNFFNII